AYEAFTLLRHIGHKATTHFAQMGPYEADTATWPHHFDVGAYMPVLREKEKDLKSIGIGLAIADKDHHEPYFYVNHWVEGDEDPHIHLPYVGPGAVWMLEDWHGTILPVSELLKVKDAAAQAELVHRFFMEAINANLKLIGEPMFEIE
ncbi:MAG: hypothetical protein AAF789_15395, partial [Bacteroidota bacterium]